MEMSEKKKKALVVNSAVCDARSLQESTLAAYEKAVINAATVLVTPRSRELLNQYGVVLNTAMVTELEEGVRLRTVNGKAELKGGELLPEGELALLVNGSLEIAPGSEEVLRRYRLIHVNGSATCPESLTPLLMEAGVINGSIRTYPDGCIRLDATAVLDRTFALRAREGRHYYARRRVVALAGDIDFGKLAEKGVRFTTKELVVAESLTEPAVPLFNEEAEVRVLPDGCAYVGKSVKLDRNLLKKYGSRLYVCGDLTVDKDSIPCLKELGFLRVDGKVLALGAAAAEAFLAIDADCDAIKRAAGIRLEDKLSVTVDRALLEAAEDGLGISDCVNVTFHKDVPPELLQERLLSISDCVNISCTPEQRAAIELAAEDVVRIDDSGKGLAARVGGMVDQLLGALGTEKPVEEMSLVEKLKLAMDCKVVNASEYVL